MPIVSSASCSIARGRSLKPLLKRFARLVMENVSRHSVTPVATPHAGASERLHRRPSFPRRCIPPNSAVLLSPYLSKSPGCSRRTCLVCPSLHFDTLCYSTRTAVSAPVVSSASYSTTLGRSFKPLREQFGRCIVMNTSALRGRYSQTRGTIARTRAKLSPTFVYHHIP